MKPCSQKRRYLTQGDAWAAMKLHNELYEKKAKSVYRCIYCGYFHITTLKKSDRKDHARYHKRQHKLVLGSGDIIEIIKNRIQQIESMK